MRIAIDVSPAVHHHAGFGRYAHELLVALTHVAPSHTYNVFYYAPRGDERPAPPLDHLPARAIRLPAKPWRMAVLLADFGGAPMDCWLPAGDVIHATDHFLRLVRGARTVFTIHDLIYRFYPEHHLPLNRWYLSLMLPRFMRRADAIIAVSENTRRDVLRLIPEIPEEKISVVYEGVSPIYRPIRDAVELSRVRTRYHLPDRFILALSTIEPRKNLPMLLEAYHALSQQRPDTPPLVLAGRSGWLYAPTFEKAHALGLEQHLCVTGWITEEDMPALISMAEAFAYPSLYEGFGLPPLEALACGAPVICSNASSLPEVIGDAGLLVSPHDVKAWVEALQRVLTDPSLRAELCARGLARARQFTWEAAARKTLAVYQAVSRTPTGD